MVERMPGNERGEGHREKEIKGEREKTRMKNRFVD